MTKKQFEELISVLREVKQSLDALRNTPNYVFVPSAPPVTLPPQTPYFGDPQPTVWPKIVCANDTNSANSAVRTIGNVQIHQ